MSPPLHVLKHHARLWRQMYAREVAPGSLRHAHCVWLGTAADYRAQGDWQRARSWVRKAREDRLHADALGAWPHIP
jgi:hypothetical protein